MQRWTEPKKELFRSKLEGRAPRTPYARHANWVLRRGKPVVEWGSLEVGEVPREDWRCDQIRRRRRAWATAARRLSTPNLR